VQWSDRKKREMEKTKMAEIDVIYLGKLRFQASRASDGRAVTTDVGADHGGQGEYLSPIEMAVSALANCAASMVAVVAERSGVDVSKFTVAAAFEMTSAPAQRIGSVQLTFHLPGGVPEAVRPKLLAAAKACPVKNSLNPDIQIGVEFVYG
jgi:putative redox protein